MADPSHTIDLSQFSTYTEGELEVYTTSSTLGGLIGNSEASVDKYALTAETAGEDYKEERRHRIDTSTARTVKDSHTVTRQTDSTEADPRIFEQMHPAVKLSGEYDPSKINLEIRDPTVLVPHQERMQDGREIYLRTPEGTGPSGNYFDGENEIPHVEGTIEESENGTTYTLKTGSGHPSAVARLKGVNKEEHLNQVLDTINIPDWETVRKQAEL